MRCEQNGEQGVTSRQAGPGAEIKGQCVSMSRRVMRVSLGLLGVTHKISSRRAKKNV